MKPRPLLWQIFPAILLVTVGALLATGLFTSRSLRGFFLERTSSDLQARAWTVARQMPIRLERGGAASVDSLCRDLGERTGTRLTMILPDGTVVGDSHENPGRMDNHGDRPEIRAALAGSTGVSVRFSATLRETLMYAAIPVRSDGESIGVLRAAMAITDIDRELGEMRRRIVLGLLAVFLVAAATSLWISRRMARPLEELRMGASRFAEGRLDLRLSGEGPREVRDLAAAMNGMAVRLDDRIRKVSDQRNELKAVLASMDEGLLAVDAAERILRINAAAGRLLGCDPAEAEGRMVQEAARNSSLLKFVTRALEASGRIEEDLTVVRDGREIHLQAVGSPLSGEQGRIGALVVLNDVTRLRRLEDVRREFVANVSHELKTPITSIRGFVETLREGAAGDPEASRRFLDILSRQSERLQAIVEDLLSLSRLEQGGGTVEGIDPRSLAPTLQAAARDCAETAAAKESAVRVDCPDDLICPHDPGLIEQAVVNLIDNALRYNPSGTRVEVAAGRVEDDLVITVQDDGKGIAEHHLPRIFERFYRVDSARSRERGGTGLGLAIVKHVAIAHGGSVDVRSRPGEGALFSIRLPGDSEQQR